MPVGLRAQGVRPSSAVGWRGGGPPPLGFLPGVKNSQDVTNMKFRNVPVVVRRHLEVLVLLPQCVSLVNSHVVYATDHPGAVTEKFVVPLAGFDPKRLASGPQHFASGPQESRA